MTAKKGQQIAIKKTSAENLKWNHKTKQNNLGLL